MVNFTINDGVLEKYSGDESGITIPGGVKKIGYRAFGDCSGLTDITIPDSVKYIEDGVFSGCTGLTGITISDDV